MAVEVGGGHLRAPRDRIERGCERTGLRQQRQQQQPRQRLGGGDMGEAGGNHRLGRLALDERHAERRIGIAPADQDRQLDAVAPRLDPRRKKSEQPARVRPRPDEQRADTASEHRRGGEREGRFVEDVGLERAGGELAPFAADRFKLRQAAPFDVERTGRVAVGERGAPRTGDRRRGATERDNRRLIGRRSDRHDRASTLPRPENQAVQTQPVFGDEEQARRFEDERHGAGDRGAGDPQPGDEREAQHEIDEEGAGIDERA